MPANALSLPAEVLCSIFVQLTLQDPAHKRALGWIATATHVCQKWRRTALAFSQLWAENVCALASDKATDCFLQRAQSAPLAFRPRYSDPYSFHPHSLTKHQLILAEKHLPRVQIFSQPLRDSKSLPLSFVKVLETSTLPHLTSLHLKRWESVTSDLFVVSYTLRAPALRELHLDSVFPSSMDTPQLRVLKVTSHGQRYSKRLQGVSATVLYAALRGMPLLEELTLKDMAARDSDDNKSGMTKTERVELPHLRHLSLHEEVHDFGFCSGLSAPAAADVNVVNACLESDVETMPFSVLFAAMEHHLRAPAYDTLVAYERDFHETAHLCVHLRSSASMRRYDDDYAITADDNNGDNDDSDEGGEDDGKHTEDQGQDDRKAKADTSTPEFRLNALVGLEMMEMQTDLPGIVALLLPHIAAERIQFLDLGAIGNVFGARKLRPLLASFINATTVQLDSDAVLGGVLSSQWSDSETDDTSSQECDAKKNDTSNDAPLLPALKHLVIEGFSAGARESKQLEEEWAAVAGILDERKRNGQAIRFVTLANAKMLSDTGRFSQAHKNLAALEACDARCMLRAKELVEKVFDARGKSSRDEDGRVTEYLRGL